MGREALLPTLAAPPLLTTEAVAHAAEIQALRDRPEAAAPVAWEEPAEAIRAPDAVEVPGEVERLLADLVRVARGREPVPFDAFVPAGSAGESFLRASLLALAGARWTGEGIAGQLGAVPVDVEPEGDGWPESLSDLSGREDFPLSRLTRLETLVREFRPVLGGRSHIQRLVTRLRRLRFLAGHGDIIEPGPLLELGIDGERMVAFIRRGALRAEAP